MNTVAWSYDKGKLLDWYKSQKVEMYTTHDKWAKHFMKDGPLEWYNPLENENGKIGRRGHGISEKWIHDILVEKLIGVIHHVT